MDSQRWIGQVDANVLTAIQDGYALYQGQSSASNVGGALEFSQSFEGLFGGQANRDQLARLNIVASKRR
jgi:hypothetical protein